MQWDDEQISRVFQEAKRADELTAPPLDRVLARSRKRRRPWVAAWTAVGALAVVLILGAIVFLRPRSRPAPSPGELEASAALLQWRSPTDFLLQNPGHELRDTLPQVGRTFTDIATGAPPASASKGERP